MTCSYDTNNGAAVDTDLCMGEECGSVTFMGMGEKMLTLVLKNNTVVSFSIGGNRDRASERGKISPFPYQRPQLINMRNDLLTACV